MAVDEEIVRLIEEAAAIETGDTAEPTHERSFARLCAADRSGEPEVAFLRVRDGLDLAYRHYRSDAPVAALMVHGAAGHGGHLHLLAEALSRRGLAEVYLPDMRGHGLSGRRRGNMVTYAEQMRDDLVDLIGLVDSRSPQATVVVGGHSAGGGLVLRLASSPVATRIAAYLLLAPFLGAQSPTTRPGLGGWIRPMPRRVRALAELNRRGVTWLNELPAMEFNQPLSTLDGRECLSWSFNTMLAFGPANWKRDLAAIGDDRPVLVVAGDGDECFRPDAYAAALAEAAPRAEVRILEGVGHWDLLVEPRVTEAAASWLGGLSHAG